MITRPAAISQVGHPQRPSTRGVESEAESEQRHRVEDVALLDLLTDGREARLEKTRLQEQGCRERRRDHAECELLARAWTREAEPESDERAGDDHPPGGVREHHRVERCPVGNTGWGGMKVEQPPVDSRQASRARGYSCRRHDAEQRKRQQVLPQRRPHPMLAGADDDDRCGKDEWQHRELNPCETGEDGKSDERQLGLACRPGERSCGGVDRCEQQRVSKRLRGDI